MEKKIIEKLNILKKEYLDAQQKITEPSIISNLKEFTKYNKIIKSNQSKYNNFIEWENLINEINDAEIIIKSENDHETINEFKKMISENKNKIEDLEIRILNSLKKSDPNDDKDVIVEIQSAAGGNEAKIFVGDLFKMYQRYFSRTDWTIELIDEEEAEVGGYSYISFGVSGENVYKHLKFESGVHRVQRIPTTETQGRIHTSTVTVSVLPEVEEVDIEINPTDIRIDTYRSGGKGGQHANKTDSAVRVTHIPTGIVAQSQDGRSQHQNKDKALTILRSRLYELKMQNESKNSAETKKSLVGTGDRSEKIRTYNYPQNRITDHRINLTLKKLDKVMDGGLVELIDNLLQEEEKN